MEPVAITLQLPLDKILKTPERSKLINSLIEDFKENGIEQVTVKEIYYVDRVSFVSATERVVNIAVTLDVNGPAVQIIESLDSLIEDGKGSTKKLAIMMGDKPLVGPDGNLVPDDDIVKLIWSARNRVETKKKEACIALAYGAVMYLVWSKEPIPIVLTVSNDNLVREIVGGIKRSLVPQVKVKWFSCSICNENVDECEHVIGEKYDDKTCVAIPRDIQFLEDTATDAVVDPRCKITDLLLIENGGAGCEWYGFRAVDILGRLKYINDARKDNLIPKEAASKFRSYFSKRSVGRCKYRVGEEKPRAQAASRRRARKV